MQGATSVPEKSHRLFVYFVGIAAALAGLLYGLDAGVITGAKLFIIKTFHATRQQEELLVSIVLFGAVVGTLLSGTLSKYCGRRFAIILSAIIFTLGAICSAMTHSLEMLVSVRFVIGIGLGIASFTAPVYLSELAPKKIRGSLIALYQLMVTIGFLLAFFSDTLLAYVDNWRAMLGIVAIPAFLMLLLMLFSPQSPRWLMLRGEKKAAKAVLEKLRYHHEVDAELEEISYSLQHTKVKASHLIQNKNFLKVIGLGMMLQAIQQFSGINAVLYYAPNIFKLAGFSTSIEQLWATVIVGLINVLTTIIALLMIDKFGRRPILFFGVVVSTLSMLALGILLHTGTPTEALRIFAVIAVLAFIFGFAIGLGPIVWILCSEIYPLQGRNFGITFSTASNWICNGLIAFTFLNVLHAIGGANTMYIFGIIGLVSLIFIALFTPETKGVSLEQIENNLMDGKSCRKLGQQ